VDPIENSVLLQTMSKLLSQLAHPFSGPKVNRLHHELLVLVHGQSQTAQRLLDLERQHSPGHSEAWYLEKVIYDLQRRR
jgi:hypothetical protein